MKLYQVGYWNGDMDEIIYRTISKTLANMVCKEANNFLGYQQYEVEEFELEAPAYKITYKTNLDHLKGQVFKEVDIEPKARGPFDEIITAEEIKC